MKMPLKMSLKTEIIPLLFVVGAIVLAAVSYSALPDRVASHWNFQGVADGYSSKMFQTIFLPSLLLIMYVLFWVLPALDPKKENYTKFANTYHVIKALIIGTLTIVFAATTLANLGYNINIGKTIAAVIGIMMIIIGITMQNLKDNWFVGVRTPWTMSSPTVWKKTHKLSTYSFIIFGIIIIIAPYLPMVLAGWLFLAGVAIAVLGPIVYSYLAYKQEKHK
ncbi:MAG TPA: SdpI family protein [bacterium]|nr:SdpI family protein [bacterium]HPT29512.1 SdpI family protein [bacterium]